MDQPLHFQIDPRHGESARACSAIARSVLPTSRTNLLLFALYILVGLASYFLTPSTRLTTFVIGMVGVLGTLYGLQAVGRATVRQLQSADSHSGETHYLEVSAEGVRAWCAHVDAR
jgi:hypothetical protein